jgi:hypothetical protein
MSATQMIEMVGKVGTIPLGKEMFVSVEILDAKNAYGSVRYLVQPVAGSGTEWIAANRFELTEATA